MERNLNHYISELTRINNVLKTPGNHTRIIAQLRTKAKQMIGKIELLPAVEGLTKVTYYLGDKPSKYVIIKAITIYEKEYYARLIADRNKVKYDYFLFDDIETLRVKKVAK